MNTLANLFLTPVVLTINNIADVVDFMNQKFAGSNRKAWINSCNHITLDNHFGGIYTLSMGAKITFCAFNTHVLFI